MLVTETICCFIGASLHERPTLAWLHCKSRLRKFAWQSVLQDETFTKGNIIFIKAKSRPHRTYHAMITHPTLETAALGSCSVRSAVW